MSSQFPVNKVEVGVKDLMSYSRTALEEKKTQNKPICVLLLTPVSQWGKSLRTYFFLHLFFVLFIPRFITGCPVAMHICWQCHKAFALQGYLMGEQDNSKSNYTQMAYIIGCFQVGTHVELFFSGPWFLAWSQFFLRWTPGTVWTPTQSAQMCSCLLAVWCYQCSRGLQNLCNRWVDRPHLQKPSTTKTLKNACPVTRHCNTKSESSVLYGVFE